MNTSEIVIQIDAEISRLQQARTLLSGTDMAIKRKPGRPAGIASSKAPSSGPAKSIGKSRTGRTLSAKARAKIAAAQKARWAKFRKAAKTGPANGTTSKAAPAKKAVSAKKASRPGAKSSAPPVS